MTAADLDISIQPLVGWPRNVTPGGSYPVTVNVRLSDPAAPWPYDEEEFVIGCMLDGRPTCTIRAIGDTGVILHRFGGTYGPARFVADVSTNQEDLADGALWLTLTTAGGMPFYIGKLPLTGDLGSAPGDGERNTLITLPEPVPMARHADTVAAAGWLFVDLIEDGRAAITTWMAGADSPAPGPVFELEWPLDDAAMEDLRWYLEDYLAAPFGVYEERGPRIQAQLAEWGAAVFTAVFGTIQARDSYLWLRARVDRVHMVFRSSSADLLGLPWELMRDPVEQVPLVLELTGMSRSLPDRQLPDPVPAPGGKLRVLMVISRPAPFGKGYQMIALPLLQRLAVIRGEVDLVVLRPPTLEALGQTLTEATARGEAFHVVHFDGHGSAGDSDSGQAEGVLVFESPLGDPHLVPASQAARMLAEAAVPVVVLNACQSGAVGRHLEAGVAARLLQAGTASVVAMAYSVYSVAAAEFMAAFYDRLFAGDPVSSAVAAGRRRMYSRNERPSPKGNTPLEDWLVPVHYMRRDVSFPLVRRTRDTELTLEEQLDQIRAPAGESGINELDPVGYFTGRDALFYELEAATRQQRVVVVHGSGGAGKTELAKAFGRWWRDTGGADDPGMVFLHSFEPEVASFGLDGVISEIGLRLFGSDFARLDRTQQRAAVEQTLEDYRMLLIWDNFETVRSMPDPEGETRLLDQEGCLEIRHFLTRLELGGRSTVLITSRTREDWLGDVRRIEVAGLDPREADVYASFLLEPYPAAEARRAKRAFGELMEWLDGHPLSMRLILPHLETVEPAALLEALRGIAPLPGVLERGSGRLTSLPASIDYSYTHLSASTRRLLPAISLLQEIAETDLLAAFSQVSGVPSSFSGATEEQWRSALDDAARVGLLTLIKVGTYRIHPALPAYLAAKWREDDAAEWRADENNERAPRNATRDAATRALAIAYGSYGDWLYQQIDSGDAGLAYTIAGLQRRTMGSMLSYALTHGLWETAQAIAQPLDSYWEARGLGDEADAWADRILLATEDASGMPSALDNPAGALWLFAVSQRAAREVGRYHLDEAERIYRMVLASTQALPPTPAQRKSLAATYHQLGLIAGERRRLDEAEDWYRRSLALEIELRDKPGTASTYHQLGMVAEYRGRLDDAEEWYRKSLAIKEEYGDRLGTAITYHQLGMVAQYRGRLDDAEEWYRKSLAIKEEYGDRLGTAITYHQLGMVAQYQGRLDKAEDWYRRSLDIRQQLGDKVGMALTFGQLGLLAEERGQIDHALEWVIRCVALFEDFPHPATGPGPAHLARLTARLGIPALEESWQTVTGEPLPQPVRDYLESSAPED